MICFVLNAALLAIFIARISHNLRARIDLVTEAEVEAVTARELCSLAPGERAWQTPSSCRLLVTAHAMNPFE